MYLDRLQKPHPYKGSFSDSLPTFIFISAFIAIFVFIFRAHQIFPEASISERAFISILYGFTTFAAVSLNTFVLQMVTSQKAENNWKAWNTISVYILHFFTVSICLYFLKGAILGELSYYSHTGLLKSFTRTIATGIIPVSIHVLYEQNQLYKKYYKQAQKLESERTERDIIETEEIKSFGSHDISISNILFLESNRNYVVFNLNDEISLNARTTLQDVENQLKEYPQFVRCHRAYIINMNKVQKVNGNAQGLKLTIQDSSFMVPVSRTYIPKIRHLLHHQN